MIGLVIVSHSRALAQALVDLIRQVTDQDISIAIAAGVGPDREEFGTDAIEIMEAIQSVYTEDGVLILMDLGSAVLSAEMALEFLPEEMRENLRFCAAPLVEGAISAAVQAGLGADLNTACQEARQALIPKAQQLGQVAEIQPEPARGEISPAPEELEEIELTLGNPHGLHARPAARFVQTAASFDANVQVRNATKGRGPVSARSLNALATLEAIKGDEVQITASGPQARQALEALQRLVEDQFGEMPEEAVQMIPPTTAAPETGVHDGAVAGISVSDGVAVGPLFIYRPGTIVVPKGKVDNPQEAWDSLSKAIDVTRAEIQAQITRVSDRLGREHAAIFEAHLLILEDPDLLEDARQLIYQEKDNAAAAWQRAIERVAESYRRLEDPYLQQRAVDVIDVGDQVLRVLLGEAPAETVEIPEPVILFASELTPTQTAQLDLEKVLGIVTATGGPTSHSAILARAMGIPAITGVEIPEDELPEEQPVGLDGFEGKLWLTLDNETRAQLEKRREAWLAERERLIQESQLPAMTRDQRRIEVVANVGGLPDAQAAVTNGAEGIGLLRTEFLFLTRNTPPTEEDQTAALRAIVEAMGDRPVIVRTLDIGGDKSVPYLDLPEEENPFLGVRAIRLSLKNPELFQTQLRSILRAGAGTNLKIMFPMISGLDEVLQARRFLEEAHRSLEDDGIPHLWPVETGIMVEVPSAAVLSPILAGYVDFFSIGTNDLTQYTLAAERGNAALTSLADALHPALLNLIHTVVQSAHQHGRWVGVCGELAGDPLAVPILIGLGVKELSLNPAGIPQVKSIIRKLDSADAQALAEKALRAESTSAVRKLAKEFAESKLQD